MKKIVKIVLAAFLLCLAALGVIVFPCFNFCKPVCVAITFDDGLENNYTVAAPILEKNGFRGLFNIVVSKVGRPGFMSWDQIVDLKRRGHEIGSHSLYHKDIGRLLEKNNKNDAVVEIRESKKILEDHLGSPIRYFCFPHGNATKGAIDLVRTHGLEPVVVERADLGGKPANPMLNVGDYLCLLSKTHVWKERVLMFHSVTSDGYGNYNDNGERFETLIKNIHDNMKQGNDYEVVNYSSHCWKVDDCHSFQYRVITKMRNFIWGFVGK